MAITRIDQYLWSEDGTAQIVPVWEQTTDGGIPPPDPQTLVGVLNATLKKRDAPMGNWLNQATIPKLATVKVLGVFAGGADLAGYRWRRVLEIDGTVLDGEVWIAEAPLSEVGTPLYEQRYITFDGVDYDALGGTDKDSLIVQPLLVPIVEVVKGASKSYWFKHGNQVRQHLGANIRKGAFIDRAPETVRNGAKRTDLIKQLDKMNKRPFGGNDSPMQLTQLRSQAFHIEFTLEHNIQAWREYLAELDQRRENGEPLIRVIVVLHDALGLSNMILKSSQQYHTGEHGHLQPQFWHDEAAVQSYIDNCQEFIRRAFDGYWHLISVIELFNEVQLHQHMRVNGQWTKQPVAYDDAVKFRDQSYRLSEVVFKAAGGRIPVSLGTRLMSDVTPEGVAEIDWTRAFFKDIRARYLHTLTCHIHPHKNATSPTQSWQGHISALNSKIVADETGRPFYFGEFWTWFPAEDVPHGLGWGRVEQAAYFCNFWLIEQNSWAALVFPTWFNSVDMNTGDQKGGLDWVFDPVGTPNVAAVYENIATNVLWQRRH